VIVSHLAAALRPFASPDARLSVDRIARIQKYDPDQASWSCSRHASAEMQQARTPRNTALSVRRRGIRGQSVAAQWTLSIVLAMFAALGGVLAGTLVARSLTADQASSSAW
jgi:hypothetical protein